MRTREREMKKERRVHWRGQEGQNMRRERGEEDMDREEEDVRN